MREDRLKKIFAEIHQIEASAEAFGIIVGLANMLATSSNYRGDYAKSIDHIDRTVWKSINESRFGIFLFSQQPATG